MAEKKQGSGKATSGGKARPQAKGGDQARKAQEWGGGTKAAKGPVTRSDKANPNSSARS